MAVFNGVVRDNHIELEGEARLAEGTRVEVHVLPEVATGVTTAEYEVKAQLRAVGLLAPASDANDRDDDFDPVVVRGELLSAQIIRERR